MKMHARIAAWLLPFFLTGCFHLHKSELSQDQWFAPPLANLPKPPLDHPDLPEEAVTIPDQPLATDADVEQEPLPPARHRRPKPTQQAANSQAEPAGVPGVSAIGQLSSGEPSDVHQEASETIVATERALNGLNRNLNGQEQKTATQIREYLKQAREALISGDLDGAYTLAAKAKVLLGELSQ